MNDYILFMHNDGGAVDPASWDTYLKGLKQSGNFQGGSSIGSGVSLSKTGVNKNITAHLSGYLRISAGSMDRAQELVRGNPVFEAGGTVEIRELPKN